MKWCLPPRTARTRCPNRGFSVIEVMIAVVIVGILAAIAIPAINRNFGSAKVNKAVSDIRLLAGELDIFELENGRLPDDLSEVKGGTMKDPWGNPYQYLNIESAGKKGKPRKDHSLHPINSKYDLYSMGEDGDTNAPLTAKASRDDIIRANDGGFVGLAANY